MDDFDMIQCEDTMGTDTYTELDYLEPLRLPTFSELFAPYVDFIDYDYTAEDFEDDY